MDRHQAKNYRDRARLIEKIIRDFDKLFMHITEYEEKFSYFDGFMCGFIEKLNKIKSFFVTIHEELTTELNR